MVLICCAILQLFSKDATIDSLKQVLGTTNSDSLKYKLCRKIGDAYYEKDTDSLMHYFNKALIIAEKRADSRAQISTLRSIAYTFSNHDSNYDKAQIYFDKAYQIAQSERDTVAQTYILSDFGVLFWKRGRNIQAIEYHFKAHQLATKRQHQALIMRTLLSLGVLYNEEKENKKAIASYERAIPIADSLKRKSVKGVLLNNMGKAYRDQAHYDTARTYFNQALALFVELEDNDWKALIYYNIAKNEQQLTNYSEAVNLYKKALDLNEIIDNKSRAAMILTGLAETYQAQHLNKLAINTAKQGLEILEKVDTRLYYAELNEVLAESYLEERQYEMAITYFQQYMIAKDSLQEREKSEKLAQYSQLYESEKKKAEIAELKVENTDKEIQLNRSQNWTRGLGAGCILLFTLFCSWYYYYKNKTLERYKALRIQLTNDLHDNINSSLNHIKIIAGRLSREQYTSEEKKTNLQRIRVISNDLVNNMHDLIWTLDDKKGKLEDLVDKMEDHASNLFTSMKIPYYLDNKVSNLGKILPTTIKNNIYSIYKEALNNIIKHTESTAVEINFSSQNGIFKMTIQNDFNILKQSSISTKIGLASMKKRTQDIKGTLTIQEGSDRFLIVLSVPI